MALTAEGHIILFAPVYRAFQFLLEKYVLFFWTLLQLLYSYVTLNDLPFPQCFSPWPGPSSGEFSIDYQIFYPGMEPDMVMDQPKVLS